MSKRNKTAVIAQAGACNPIPLIRGLASGLDELRAENPEHDHQAILNDPALRLIVHQLAHLFRVGEFSGLDVEQYRRLCQAVGMTEA